MALEVRGPVIKLECSVALQHAVYSQQSMKALQYRLNTLDYIV